MTIPPLHKDDPLAVEIDTFSLDILRQQNPELAEEVSTLLTQGHSPTKIALLFKQQGRAEFLVSLCESAARQIRRNALSVESLEFPQ